MTQKNTRLKVKIPPRIFCILLLLVAAAFCHAVGLAIPEYPETYKIFEEPMSRLGGNTSTGGLPNPDAAYIFRWGLTITAICGLLVSAGAAVNRGKFPKPWKCCVTHCELKKWKFKVKIKGPCAFRRTAFIMGAGAWMIAMPRDHPTAVGRAAHIAGVIFFLGGFFFFNLLAQNHKRERKLKKLRETMMRPIAIKRAVQWETCTMWAMVICAGIYVVSLAINKGLDEQYLLFRILDATFQKVTAAVSIFAMLWLTESDMLFPETIEYPADFTPK